MVKQRQRFDIPSADTVVALHLVQNDLVVCGSRIEVLIKWQRGDAVNGVNGLGATTGNDNLYPKNH